MYYYNNHKKILLSRYISFIKNIMTQQLENESLSDKLFKLKQGNSQASYLCFNLADTSYAINIQNIINIIEKPNMVYLSHISPPIIGMQHYNKLFIPVLDFGGYRPYNKNYKLLVLSSNYFRKDNPFCLIVDEINELKYFKQKDLIKNPYPFNNLLPSYYYYKAKRLTKKSVHFLDVQDLENQID